MLYIYIYMNRDHHTQAPQARWFPMPLWPGFPTTCLQRQYLCSVSG